MNETLTDILEKVLEALDATSAEADRVESLLLEDPVSFAHRFREHLDAKDRAQLGAPDGIADLGRS